MYGPLDEKTKEETLAELAGVYGERGEVELQLSTSEQAVKLAERVYGVDHLNYAVALRNLGLAHFQHGDMTLALDEVQAALAIYERTVGDTSAQVASLLNDVAMIDDNLGKSDEAIAALGRALAIMEKKFGPEHVSLVMYLDNLATANIHHAEVARPLFERALAILRAHDEHDEPMAQLLNDYANMLIVNHETAKGLTFLAQAHDIYVRLYGKDSPQVAMVADVEGNGLLDAGRFAEAIAVLTPIIDDVRRTPLNRAISGSTLASALWNHGEHARAIAAAQAALALAKTAQGDKGAAMVKELNDWLAKPD